MFIISIDVGIKNLGFSVYDLATRQLVQWQNECLCDSKFVASKNVEYVHAFIDKYATFFADAHRVLIERQMRVNMKVIEAVFQSRFFEKTIVLPAQCIKMHFDLSCQNYRANKKKAIEFIDLQFGGLLQDHFVNMHEWVDFWHAQPKKDDLADSLLMVLYYLHSYSDLVHENGVGL